MSVEREREHVLLIERELGSPNRAKGNLHINNLSPTAGNAYYKRNSFRSIGACNAGYIQLHAYHCHNDYSELILCLPHTQACHI